MQKLFHVNSAAFNRRHDRECELENGYMHRAYMMSGLRSFAWTLADYCQRNQCEPDSIDNNIASEIVNYVKNTNWLNYTGDSYCQGLCGGSDLHVFFVPDDVSKEDKERLLPSQEDKENMKHMNVNLSVERGLLGEVHSLNALRKDLAYICPAIETLWNSLKEERDYNKALLGNEADIVYAWCALALAAKGPFFTEDGPMTCSSSQSGSKEVLLSELLDKSAEEHEQSVSLENVREKASAEWMQQYEKYLEKDAVIKIKGSSFVFSCFEKNEEKKHPIVQAVIEKGGLYRSSVSGLTNYLVVAPRYADQSKILAVIEQLKKGKQIKVVLLEDLEKNLEREALTEDASRKVPESIQENLKDSDEEVVNQNETDSNIVNSITETKTNEDDIVNMYIILTNEKKLGKLRRSQKEFYSTYKEVFSNLKKSDVLKIRTAILQEMENGYPISKYVDSFKKRPAKERFDVSTRYLLEESTEPDFEECVKFAVYNSKEWFLSEEYAEVNLLMDAEKEKKRREIEDDLISDDETWAKFSTAKKSLKVIINEKERINSDIQKICSCFIETVGDNVVFVGLYQAHSDHFTTTVIENNRPWFWGVTVRDIWDAAIENGVFDCRKDHSNGEAIAYEAIIRMALKYTDKKVQPAPKECSETISNHHSDVTTPSSQLTQPAKKEGCYIATAVYGSYDAPQVITLRKYRDETLRNTAFGRWFIRTYYKLSPPVAEKLKDAKQINRLVRLILDKWVDKLDKKQK